MRRRTSARRWRYPPSRGGAGHRPAEDRGELGHRGPIVTPKETAALGLASLFSKDYHAISDEHVARWRELFGEDELIELGVSLAICDGFGTLVEVLGLGQPDQVGTYEL